MKKTILVLLVAILVLSAVTISALAAPQEGRHKVHGVWCYQPTGLLPVTLPGDEYVGDPNKQFVSAAYVSEWTGSLSGSSQDYGLAIAHFEAPILFIGTASFKEAKIFGKVGGLEMDSIGDRRDATADWKGKWIITSGSGDLENIRGRGRFWGPGWLPPDGGGFEECPEGYGLIYYSGFVRFPRHDRCTAPTGC